MMHDVGLVGGKNASLGEMISQLSQAGVNVPAGFSTTTKAYREFLVANGLVDRINHVLDGLDIDDINALTAAGKNNSRLGALCRATGYYFASGVRSLQ